ncbi:MAG: hypothetical protein OHK0056_22240 [Bacteriovoracaceae bacterium]
MRKLLISLPFLFTSLYAQESLQDLNFVPKQSTMSLQYRTSDNKSDVLLNQKVIVENETSTEQDYKFSLALHDNVELGFLVKNNSSSKEDNNRPGGLLSIRVLNEFEQNPLSIIVGARSQNEVKEIFVSLFKSNESLQFKTTFRGIEIDSRKEMSGQSIGNDTQFQYHLNEYLAFDLGLSLSLATKIVNDGGAVDTGTPPYQTVTSLGLSVAPTSSISASLGIARNETRVHYVNNNEVNIRSQNLYAQLGIKF